MVIRATLAILLLLLASPAVAQSQQAEPERDKPWWERITFFGDFRARYEGFFQDEAETRQRGRYRVRVGLRSPIADGLNFNLRLASGESSDVNSTNQTLGEFFNRKPFNIDQVSLTYTPPDVKPLTLGVGKYAYPVTRTQLVWDDDVNWEGSYEQLTFAGAGGRSLRLVAAQTTLNEAGGGADAFMFGHQAQATFPLGRHRAQIAIADYYFRHPDQIAVALDQRTTIRTQSTNRLRRNSAGRVTGFASGFNLVDAIGQVTFNTGRSQYPLVALVDYVVNTRAAGDDDTGVWLSAAYGRAAAPKTYAATYTFARVERDAVVSAFNFSDMGPATNVVMNMATFSYMPKNRVNLDAIAILTRDLDAPGPSNPLLARIQVDVRVAF